MLSRTDTFFSVTESVSDLTIDLATSSMFEFIAFDYEILDLSEGDLPEATEFCFLIMLLLDLNETDFATILFSLSSRISLSSSSTIADADEPSFERRNFEIRSLRSDIQVSGSSLLILSWRSLMTSLFFSFSSFSLLICSSKKEFFVALAYAALFFSISMSCCLWATIMWFSKSMNVRVPIDLSHFGVFRPFMLSSYWCFWTARRTPSASVFNSLNRSAKIYFFSYSKAGLAIRFSSIVGAFSAAVSIARFFNSVSALLGSILDTFLFASVISVSSIWWWSIKSYTFDIKSSLISLSPFVGS